MDLFFVLLILLVVTRAFGELAERVGQPALVGELISGILLGATLAYCGGSLVCCGAESPDMSGLENNTVFRAITDLGMFLIMLFAGIEMQPHKILRYSGPSFLVAVGGMVLPLALGFGLGWMFLPETPLRFAQAAFIGTALAITAVPATVKILIDLGKLDSPSGQIIVSAAAFDDVLSLLLLAWLTGVMGGGGEIGFGDLGLLTGKVVLFFAITVSIGTFLFPRFGQLIKNGKEKELELSSLLIAAFGFAVLAEALDLHFILGAFVAGIFFGRRTIDAQTYEDVRSKVSGMTFGFLAPVFFASVGLHLTFGVFTEVPVFLVLLLVAAFAGKLFGAGAMAALFGMSRGESMAIGVGMSARGAVELVIADIALEAGLFAHAGGDPILSNMFSAVVVMAIVTTLVTPVLLKRIYRDIPD